MGAIFQEDWELKGECPTEEKNAGLHSNWHLGFKLVVVVVLVVLGGGGGGHKYTDLHVVCQMRRCAYKDEDPLSCELKVITRKKR